MHGIVINTLETSGVYQINKLNMEKMREKQERDAREAREDRRELARHDKEQREDMNFAARGDPRWWNSQIPITQGYARPAPPPTDFSKYADEIKNLREELTNANANHDWELAAMRDEVQANAALKAYANELLVRYNELETINSQLQSALAASQENEQNLRDTVKKLIPAEPGGLGRSLTCSIRLRKVLFQLTLSTRGSVRNTLRHFLRVRLLSHLDIRTLLLIAGAMLLRVLIIRRRCPLLP